MVLESLQIVCKNQFLSQDDTRVLLPGPSWYIGDLGDIACGMFREANGDSKGASGAFNHFAMTNGQLNQNDHKI